MEQKYHKYDLVQIADKMPEYMSHFISGKRAIIIGSYADQFGGDDTDSYTLYIEKQEECSWYEENQLTLIKKDSKDLLDQWKAEETIKEKKESDLEWIVKNWNKMDAPSGYTMNRLMAEIGITEPWGKHGEGIDLFLNQTHTFELLNAVLETGNLEKVREFIKNYPKINKSISNHNISGRA